MKTLCWDKLARMQSHFGEMSSSGGHAQRRLVVYESKTSLSRARISSTFSQQSSVLFFLRKHVFVFRPWSQTTTEAEGGGGDCSQCHTYRRPWIGFPAAPPGWGSHFSFCLSEEPLPASRVQQLSTHQVQRSPPAPAPTCSLGFICKSTVTGGGWVNQWPVVIPHLFLA